MIEDLFFKRYEVRDDPENLASIQRVSFQAGHIFFSDIASSILEWNFFEKIKSQVQREFGIGSFYGGSSGEARYHCKRFLEDDLNANAYQLRSYGDIAVLAQATPRYNNLAAIKISLVELLFRRAEEHLLRELKAPIVMSRTPPRGPGSGMRVPSLTGKNERARREDSYAKFKVAVTELNARFREAGFPFHYHNGLIQQATDILVEKVISEPFWSVVSDPKWKNVDDDMKEARHRADTNGVDSALYASMALESTIKIISGEKGWTRGKEKGAHAYIDNLQSANNGSFVQGWEADAMKAIFTQVRNPHGHGPGSAPQPSLSREQTEWVIESCMSWIKSLIHRL